MVKKKMYWLFTETGAVTETGVISQDIYFSNICQVVGLSLTVSLLLVYNR